MNTAIWWIRRDIRLSDNPALAMALERSSWVIPLFIIDPQLEKSPYFSQRRWDFLCGCLNSLDEDLRHRGSRLIVRRGNPYQVLLDMTREYRVEAIFAEPDVSPYARQRDVPISKELPLQWFGSPAVHPPGSIVKPDGSPYTVFTPFNKRWKALPFPTLMDSLTPVSVKTPGQVSGMAAPIPVKTHGLDEFTPGEKAANERLDAFCYGKDAPIYRYAQTRNLLNEQGTSGLSPYLRLGCISPSWVASRAYWAIQNAPNSDAKRSAQTWLDELIWRDFYIHILYHFPDARKYSFRSDLLSIQWLNDPDHFSAWCMGRTGYPVVDAGMRQLLHSSWMHNRARMITASFLVKDLLIDWRWGEKWFMQHLIDGDPAANNGGWQWTAGTGTDAAPYFRVFNPVLQGKKFDPHGAYIRSWVPELASLPDEFIHQPWLMTPMQQKEFGCIIAVDYPERLVDHTEARIRMLKVFRQAKDGS